MSGGIFQLIAYGAQDLYLMGNYNDEPKIYQPKTLQKYAFHSMSKAQKVYLCNNYGEVFPEIVKKCDNELKCRFVLVLHRIRYGFLYVYNYENKEKVKVIEKAKEHYTLAEQESQEIQKRLIGHLKQKKREIIKKKRIERIKMCKLRREEISKLRKEVLIADDEFINLSELFD